MNETDVSCPPRVYDADEVRMVIIVLLGALVSVAGVLLNSFLLLSFTRLQFFRTNLYLFLLAIQDIIVEVCFVLIFVCSLLWDFLEIYPLYYAWHQYIRYVSTIGQILILSSTLLIVAASLERYLCSLYTQFVFSPQLRFVMVGIVFLCALVLKGCVFFEIQLQYLPGCPEFSDLLLEPSSLTRSDWYRSLWMFWGRSILTVILPFVLLLFLNTATIQNLNRTTKDIDSMLVELARFSLPQQMPSFATAKHEAATARKRKRDATKTLAALITVYLITNSLNLCLTILEFFDQAYLLEMGNGWAYKYIRTEVDQKQIQLQGFPSTFIVIAICGYRLGRLSTHVEQTKSKQKPCEPSLTRKSKTVQLRVPFTSD